MSLSACEGVKRHYHWLTRLGKASRQTGGKDHNMQAMNERLDSKGVDNGVNMTEGEDEGERTGLRGNSRR